MAEALKQTYPHFYFRKRFGYRGAYHRFAEAILEVFEPESLIDVGCGMGWIVEFCLPRIPVMGVEGSAEAIWLQKPHVRRVVHLADLTGPVLPQAADYELCVSIEVAEHIEIKHMPAFVEWVTRGKRALLTAAPPGQGGRHHVNEQPPKYWKDVMEARGFAFRGELTERWKENASARTPQAPWVVRNALYFERDPQWSEERRRIVLEGDNDQ